MVESMLVKDALGIYEMRLNFLLFTVQSGIYSYFIENSVQTFYRECQIKKYKKPLFYVYLCGDESSGPHSLPLVYIP
jgi:hypothetical protein